MPSYVYKYVYTTANKEIYTTTNKVVVLTATPVGIGGIGGGSVTDYPTRKFKKELELNLVGIKAIPFFLAISLVGDKAFATEKILALIGQILNNKTADIDVSGISAIIVKDQKDIEAILLNKVININTLSGVIQNDFLDEYEVAGLISKKVSCLNFMIGVKDIHSEIVKILIRTGEKEIETMSSILGSKLFATGLNKLLTGSVKKGDVNLKLELQGKRDIRKIILSLFRID